MRVVKCESNHFFDADKYSVCPQCGAGIRDASDSSANSVARNSFSSSDASEKSHTDKTFGVFKKSSFKSKKNNDSVKSKPSGGSDNYAKLKEFSNNSQQKVEAVNRPSLNPNSLLFGTMGMETGTDVEKAHDPEPEYVQDSFQPSLKSDSVESKSIQEEGNNNTQSEDSLLDEIKKISSDNDGKTVGFFSSGKHSDPNNSDDSGSGKDNNALSDEPVVGWLVCIGGPNIGQSFNIYAGRNSLGRSNNNKIVVGKDRSISREKHAWIIFEPKNGEFFALPGESSGLTYVNDQNIMQATKLEKWSVIEVGNTRLIFVPLCDGEFSWEKYL